MNIEQVGELKIKPYARAIVMSISDNIALLLSNVHPGDVVKLIGSHSETSFIASQNISSGREIAISRIGFGAPLIKSGQIIGRASNAIEPGHQVDPENHQELAS